MNGRPIALVRAVPDVFTDCVTGTPAVPPLSPTVARRQHAGYAAALEAGGFAVRTVPASEAHPDCSFIEDAAVVRGERALVTRPGHPSRRGEGVAVAAALEGLVEIATMDEGTLDGGDVLQVGGEMLVGLSRRTDGAGIAALARTFGPVRAVPVRATLHLKSGVSAVDDETVLWHPAACDRDDLGPVRVVEVPGDDPEGANVVRLPDGSVLVARHQQATADLVASLGHTVAIVDVSEFARADGGLTCLSLRLRSVYGG